MVLYIYIYVYCLFVGTIFLFYSIVYNYFLLTWLLSCSVFAYWAWECCFINLSFYDLDLLLFRFVFMYFYFIYYFIIIIIIIIIEEGGVVLFI